MHIIKTAFKKSWPNTLDDSIFLGDWCIKGDVDKKKLSKSKVLEYHFDDRKNLNTSKDIIDDIYYELLEILTKVLNKLFAKNYNKRYWEVIWGFWLYMFVLVIYDRNLSIKNALKNFPKSTTNVLDPKSYITVLNTRDYMDYIQDDFFNFQIYSSLWKMHNGNVNSIISTLYQKKKSDYSIYNSLNTLLMSSLKLFFRPIFDRSTITFFSTGLPKKMLLKLIIKFKIIPFELFVNKNISETQKLAKNLTLRSKLKNSLYVYKNKNNPFLNICLKMISDHVPISILERYRYYVEINRKNIKRANFLFSSNGFINDQWNILCAENIKNGAKLINCQHGGGYGIQMFSGVEDYELRVADKYITTGWNRRPREKFIAMPLPFINKMKTSIRRKNNNKIFYIRNDYPRYLYRIFSHPIGKYVGMYRKSSDRFLKNLDKKLYYNTLVRLYQKDQDESYDIFKKNHPQVKYDNYKKTFEYQLKNCKIAISDTNQTTFLQSIALGIPTIIFWDPLCTEINSDAKNLMNKLNKVGILHYSPESAANFINKNYECINVWWMSDEVRKVRNSFISKYANTSNNWENDWIQFIKKYLVE